jgi:hypothetical protein
VPAEGLAACVSGRDFVDESKLELDALRNAGSASGVLLGFDNTLLPQAAHGSVHELLRYPELVGQIDLPRENLARPELAISDLLPNVSLDLARRRGRFWRLHGLGRASSGTHRAVGRATPGEAYRATPKALPSDSRGRGHFRLRYDVTDAKGVMTLRRGGRMHHLKVGAAHARRRVLAIVDEREVTVVNLATGEILSSHVIEPDKGYWRNQQRDPGRWPGSKETS